MNKCDILSAVFYSVWGFCFIGQLILFVLERKRHKTFIKQHKKRIEELKTFIKNAERGMHGKI